jgi:methyltransferase (TIGR00027 family)
MRRRRALAAPLALAGAWAAHPGPALATAVPSREPSQTALGAAVQRAAHRLLERPLIFDDPLSLPILGLERVRWLATHLDRFRSAGAGALRASLVVRSRAAEDALAEAVAGGTRQAVILGAGLDTFGCRNPHPRLRVFEVDLPATQAWKRERLADQGIAVPRSLAFVAVDFETQTLEARLAAAGLRTEAPVFFSWLGVTMYLSREAIAQTLRYAGTRCAPGSTVVFDYLPAAATLPAAARRARDALAARVAAAGEPWISEFEPAALAALVRAQGFRKVHDLDADALQSRYFAGRADGFALTGSARLMVASV